MEQARQSHENAEDEPAIEGADGSTCGESTDRAPYPTRLRVVLLLALVCWAVVIAAVWAVARP